MTRGVIVGDTILCPKALDKAEVIFEALYPFALEHPESIELNLTIAQSNPENELAARNDISIATASGFKFSVHTPEIAKGGAVRGCCRRILTLVAGMRYRLRLRFSGRGVVLCRSVLTNCPSRHKHPHRCVHFRDDPRQSNFAPSSQNRVRA